MTSGFIEILRENAGVQAVVGLNRAGDKYKVYPVRAPQSEEIDYVTVFKTQNDAAISLTKDLPSQLDYPRVTVVSWSKVFRRTEMMFEACRLALDGGGFITDAGYLFQRIWLIDDRDGFDNEAQLYCHIATFGVEEKRLATGIMQSIVNSNYALWGGVWVFADNGNNFPSANAGTIFITSDAHGNAGDIDYVPQGSTLIALVNGTNSYDDFNIDP